MKKKYTIAIDGPAASGKSTTARLVAKQLGYLYIDTGAMYRAATLAVLNADINPFDKDAVAKIIEKSTIDLKMIGDTQHTFLEGADVSHKIRSPQIDKAISNIATNAVVRKIMVKQQQTMAKQGGIVMDGRDIGTVVLPDADIKIFMRASIDARAQRRMKDHSGLNISLDEIKKDIAHRDYLDMTRKESPLKKADDAVELDTSDLTIKEQVTKILDLIESYS